MSTEKDEQMETSSRLREAIQAKGLKIKDAADICGIPYRSLQNYTLGLREPNAEALRTISSRLNISSDWLLTGEGPMFRGEQASPAQAPSNPACNPREEAILALFRSLNEDEQREIQGAAEEKKRLRVLEQQVAELSAALATNKRSA